jgi:hypothetical protein
VTSFLSGDAIRMKISFNEGFVISNLLILVIFSWIAVFYHTWRLARINPVEFIKEQ